jgi:hypothetical protein
LTRNKKTTPPPATPMTVAAISASAGASPTELYSTQPEPPKNARNVVIVWRLNGET